MVKADKTPGVIIDQIHANGIDINVATIGQGPAILLLHGWPHDWHLWQSVMPALAEAGYRAIAPDMRGLGLSTRATEGYDLHTLADDMAALLDALHVDSATVAGIDLGAPVAFMLAMRHAKHVRRLVLSESLLGDLPGAEAFLSHGGPWWFGFHAIPGLAERAIEGNEEAYIGWFLAQHCHTAIPNDVAEGFIRSYHGRESLRCGFEYYRAFPQQAQQIRAATAKGKVKQPVLTLIGGIVGDAIHSQLAPIAPRLARVDVSDCGHLVPLEQPAQCAKALIAFERGEIAP